MVIVKEKSYAAPKDKDVKKEIKYAFFPTREFDKSKSKHYKGDLFCFENCIKYYQYCEYDNTWHNIKTIRYAKEVYNELKKKV